MTTRRGWVAAIAWAVLALVAFGCSRGPKPKAAVAEPAPSATIVDRGGQGSAPIAVDDTLTTKKPAAKPKNGNGGAKPAPPAPEPVPNALSGGSSSAPAVPDTIAVPEPALSPEERAKLEEKTRTTIDAAKAKLESVEATRLDAERLRKYRLANDYLAEAVRARDGRDLQKASALALKAKLLAEEL